MGRTNLADTETMDRFIDSLDHLTEEQLLGMAAAWHSSDEQAREDAWTQVRAVGLAHEVEHVRQRALDFATGAGVLFYPYTIDSDDLARHARREAAPALVDAAIAIALGDRLDETTREVLLGPWLRVSEQG
jgi:hypothetical protein